MRTGRCQCSDVHYESTGEPVATYVCHCLECQKQSASAFGISLYVPKSGFRVTLGTPKFWYRYTDNGNEIKCAFCPRCGSRLWHDLASTPLVISIKAGSLDKPIDIGTAIHVWVKRKLPGIVIAKQNKQYLEED